MGTQNNCLQNSYISAVFETFKYHVLNIIKLQISCLEICKFGCDMASCFTVEFYISLYFLYVESIEKSNTEKENYKLAKKISIGGEKK